MVDWGASSWWLAGPQGSFTTNSISLMPGLEQASFTFLKPSTLLSLEAYNRTLSMTTIRLSCPGSPDVEITLPPRQVTIIATLWTRPCSTVTVRSANGWQTRFDNFYYR